MKYESRTTETKTKRKTWDVNIYEPNEDVIDKITQDKHITEFILQDKK